MTTDHVDTAAAMEAAERHIARLWSFREVLREDGLSTADFLDVLTCLLLLKIVDGRYETDERLQWTYDRPNPYPWREPGGRPGESIARDIKNAMSFLDGVLQDLNIGEIVSGTRIELCSVAKLIRLAELIDEIVPGDDANTDFAAKVYEGLLAMAAADAKEGISQYFTPRAVIDAMIEATIPTTQDTVMDPACGTGGFLIAARIHARGRASLTPADSASRRQPERTVRGVELVPAAARLAAANMLLHGLGDIDDGPMIRVGDSLAYMSGQASLVLSNPPFGVHSPVKVHATDDDPLAWYEPGRGRADFSYSRPDFVSTTANRPLKFLQHVASSLEPGGRAAVVVPDNALFVDRDGETVRRHLLRNFDVHTLLRLPAGAIPPGGIRSNVLFFNRPTEPPRDTPCTRRLWVYDLRAERFSGDKRAPLQRDAFDDFVACYLPGRDHDERKETERFRAFAYEDLVARDAANLDLWWDEDAAEEERRPPHLIAEEIVNDLSVALGEFSAITDILRARHAESADGW